MEDRVQKKTMEEILEDSLNEEQPVWAGGGAPKPTVLAYIREGVKKGLRYGVPPDHLASLTRYWAHGIPTGDFLAAVLRNDLQEAMGRADEHSRMALYPICLWIHNVLPVQLHGSSEKIGRHIEDMMIRRQKEED